MNALLVVSLRDISRREISRLSSVVSDGAYSSMVELFSVAEVTRVRSPLGTHLLYILIRPRLNLGEGVIGYYSYYLIIFKISFAIDDGLIFGSLNICSPATLYNDFQYFSMFLRLILYATSGISLSLFLSIQTFNGG